MNDKEIIENNKRLVRKFPFLRPTEDFDTGRPVSEDDYDYSYTVLDELWPGWRKSFVEQMCQEIYDELVETGHLDDYIVEQAKEKFGFIHWYDYGGTDRIDREIIPKYEEISSRTCILCGAPATKRSTGWICPYCDKCAPKDAIPINYKEHKKKGKVEND